MLKIEDLKPGIILVDSDSPSLLWEIVAVNTKTGNVKFRRLKSATKKTVTAEFNVFKNYTILTEIGALLYV